MRGFSTYKPVWTSRRLYKIDINLNRDIKKRFNNFFYKKFSSNFLLLLNKIEHPTPSSRFFLFANLSNFIQKGQKLFLKLLGQKPHSPTYNLQVTVLSSFNSYYWFFFFLSFYFSPRYVPLRSAYLQRSSNQRSLRKEVTLLTDQKLKDAWCKINVSTVPELKNSEYQDVIFPNLQLKIIKSMTQPKKECF